MSNDFFVGETSNKKYFKWEEIKWFTSFSEVPLLLFLLGGVGVREGKRGGVLSWSKREVIRMRLGIYLFYLQKPI